MRTIYCGKIEYDDIMTHCIATRKFTQKEQYDLGYNWDVPQNIVYTNNEMFFYGVRVAVHDGLIDHKDITIIFTNSDNKQHQPLIDHNGRIDYWPKGFFDQMENALLELL